MAIDCKSIHSSRNGSSSSSGSSSSMLYLWGLHRPL